jgi:hypothetical protein
VSNQFSLVLKQEHEISLNQELIDYLKEKLISERIAREEAEEELDKLKQELENLKSTSTKMLVRMVGLITKDGSNKFYYQLRRFDNNKWLWTSQPRRNKDTAFKETQSTIERFGWELYQFGSEDEL